MNLIHKKKKKLRKTVAKQKTMTTWLLFTLCFSYTQFLATKNGPPGRFWPWAKFFVTEHLTMLTRLSRMSCMCSCAWVMGVAGIQDGWEHDGTMQLTIFYPFHVNISLQLCLPHTHTYYHTHRHSEGSMEVYRPYYWQ